MGRCSRALITRTVTNSELNHFLLSSVIFNKNYKEPSGGGDGGGVVGGWGCLK